MPQDVQNKVEQHFDTVIVGFGKAGKSLAGDMAKAGRSVAIIERDSFLYGGSCVNVACVPTKTLLHDAEQRSVSQAGDAEFYRGAIARKNTLREKMNAANLANVEDPGAIVIDGQARFVGERRLEVSAGDDAMIVTGDHVLINTGSTPRLPDIDGLTGEAIRADHRILTSRELISTEDLPERIAILGAGFIAMELANMYAQFGSEVTILNRSDRLARSDDAVVSETLEEILTDNGVNIEHDTELVKVDVPGDGADPLTLTLETDGRTRQREVDTLLISIGRVPAIDDLDLEAAGVETEDGAVKVDDFLRTSAKNVWAAGDVNGGPQHTYISYDDYRIVADQLLRGKDDGYSLAKRGHVPTTTFITPPFSRVGLSETDARAQAADRGWVVAAARKNVADIAGMPRPKAVGDPRGFLQVVVDRNTDLILGATLLAIESQEVINLVALAMNHEIPYTELRDAIYTHPAATEGLNWLLREI